MIMNFSSTEFIFNTKDYSVSMTWLVGLIVATLVYQRHSKSQQKLNPKNLPYPKGPTGLPYLGNALQMPPTDQWITFAEWAEEFGSMTGLRVLGKNIVILNTFDAAMDLLHKRGAIYSSRPAFPLLQQFGGWDFLVSTAPYGEYFLTQRRMLHQYFNPSATRKYYDIVTSHARSLAYDLLERGERVKSLNRMYVGATVMLIAYGYEVTDENDVWINNAKEAMLGATKIGTPGAHPIDIFPILGKLPYRIWGKDFGRNIEALKKGAHDVCVKPYAATKERILRGEAMPSIMSRLIEENTAPDGTIGHEKEISAATSVIYIAGADTTVSTIDTFIVAMLTYPEIQKRAQKDLDNLLHGERLPTFEDRDQLPFLSAIVKETLRWKPVAPLGIPHTSIEDDTYNGFFLPKDTMFLVNAWGVCYDSATYPKPDEFNPWRFLKEDDVGELSLRSDIRDPEDVIFGFGRRLCVGRDLALATLWITIATLLSVYDICAPLDDQGRDIKPDLEYVTGTVSHPKPFRCRFVPRSPRKLSKLREAKVAHDHA
ncbi:cytochrome P450 [Sistotremastrum suecicum HHB10207 ss-3]|uniref:Cytochrome P450 n=1 Tax=Sistotremastrum suecicum HHB10207 ss-3 TaxID=1314776 RepID=A0A166DZH4_9AGAM|nr:cytochrome P450 [Sistotremastrum suecicum HHB10207 ss-3]